MPETKTKPATEEKTELEPKTGEQVIADYVPGSSWEDLSVGADEVFGNDLAKDELLDALDGVPILIHRVTFRNGVMKNGEPGDYVSVEAVIAPQQELLRRRINLETLPFSPNQSVVFNDGSTGIYRQIVSYLRMKGFIDLPEGPTEGEAGASVCDLPIRKWANIHNGEICFDSEGNEVYTANIRLKCPRGLRRSEYTSKATGTEATTRYIA